MSSRDLRTHLGVVRGGLPEEPGRSDVVMIVGEPDGARVLVHALRVAPDPQDLEGPKSERELELVASFWLRTEYFLSTFGGVVADIERRAEDGA